MQHILGRNQHPIYIYIYIYISHILELKELHTCMIVHQSLCFSYFTRI